MVVAAVARHAGHQTCPLTQGGEKEVAPALIVRAVEENPQAPGLLLGGSIYGAVVSGGYHQESPSQIPGPIGPGQVDHIRQRAGEGGGDHGHHRAEIPQGRRPAKTHSPAADDHRPPSGKVDEEGKAAHAFSSFFTSTMEK